MGLDLLVFGDTAIDNFYEVKKLPKNDEAADIMGGGRFYGGMGANTAVVANNLGLSTGLVSVIGTDAEDYRNYMASQGIKMYLKGIFGDTTKSMFFKSPEGQISFFQKGVTKQLEDLDPVSEFGAHIMRGVETVYLARTYLKMQKRVASSFGSSRIVYNPGYGIFLFEKVPTLFRSVIKASDRVILNHHELAHLKSIGYRMRIRPYQAFIVTMGSSGARVYQGDSVVDIPAYKTRSVDAAGAGDAFNAGLIAAERDGLDIYEAVRFANATASFIVEKWGCQTNLPSYMQVKKRYESMR